MPSELARYTSGTIEEAPVRGRAWLHQRVRWIKGFLQTSLTHGRAPLETIRRLGPVRGLAALALVPGAVLSALVYPLYLVLTVYDLFLRTQPEAPTLLSRLPQGLSVLLFVAGFLALMLPAALGCIRRGWLDLTVWVPLMPAYFCCVSLAAWLAVLELVRAPNRWNKTEHGLARTSRSGLLRPGRKPSG